MKWLRKAGFWLLLAALVALAVRLERRPFASEEIKAASGEGVHIIDGDSLRIGDREIRIAGIDAPEYRQSCFDEAGGEWPCGKEARAALEALVRAGGLSCAKEAEDRYGRSLARCRAGKADVATHLALQGWALDARDKRFPAPLEAIAEARAARRGIWRGRHQHPADWRRAQSKPAA
jgi:endonuclease YncB( thermonuclease family)